MSYTRTLNTWKIFHLVRGFKKPDHRIYSTVCSVKKLNLENNRLSCMPLDILNCQYSTNKAFDTIKKEDKGILRSFMDKVGWLDVERSRLKFSGYLLFESVVDQTNYEQWFLQCKLPNTFLSWFIVTELHVWMLLVRCMAEKENGKLLRNAIIEALWSDTLAKLGSLGSSAKSRQNIDQLSEEFQASLIGYDEGLLSSDIVLASALWRRFFLKSTNDAVLVENLIKYIRKQVNLLEVMSSQEFMNRPQIKWTPLLEKNV